MLFFIIFFYYFYGTMLLFLKSRWPLFFILTIFIICKIPHLYYPYYWDESWPYASAIKAMYHHGISFLPGAIDPDLSRGHPLFFFAIAATWMDIFGSSHVAMHSFALFISVGMLIAVYEAGLRLFNQRVAVISTLLIATQVIFFVQSSFVLLEVLVALLVFLSIYCYTSRHYFLTTLCLTALFYTKESGLVAGVVLGLDALTGLFNPAMDMKKRLSGLASVILPCVLIFIFFIIQKIDRGWYVFPLHNSLVEHAWGPFWYRFRMACLRGAFEEGFRFYYFITLLVLAIIAAIKNKSIRYLALFPAAFMLYYFVDDLRCGRLLSSIPNFIIFLLSVFLILYIFSRPRFYPHPRQRRFIVLTGLFVYCYFCFSGMNFFTLRYIFAALIPLLFLTAVFYDLLISQSFKVLYYPLLGFILLVGFLSFKSNEGSGDCDLGAFDAMDVQQGMVNYLQNNNCYNKNIGGAWFLTKLALTNPDCGYIKGGASFQKVNWDINKETDFVIFENINPDKRHDGIKTDSSFTMAYKYTKGSIWGEIYRRK